MTKRLNQLTHAEKQKIKDDMLSHGDRHRCASENDVSVRVVDMICGTEER